MTDEQLREFKNVWPNTDAGALAAELLALRARYADLDRTSEAELAACEKERDQLAARVAQLGECLRRAALKDAPQ